VNSLGAPVDPETGNISFCQEMINVYSEVSYERTKGPKILSRIPQDCSDDISFDASSALEKNYDFVFAVDTNTLELAGKSLSAVGIVTTSQCGFLGDEAYFMAGDLMCHFVWNTSASKESLRILGGCRPLTILKNLALSVKAKRSK